MDIPQDQASRSQFGIGSDSPISAPEQDRFRRTPFARQIASAIDSRGHDAGPVIGIYGGWGEGKTSVLNLIECELQGTNDVVSVRFDPWQYGDQRELMVYFFGTLAAALDQSLNTTKEKFADVIANYAAPLIPTVGLGPVTANVSTGIQDVARQIASVDMKTLRSRVDDMLLKSGKRIVLFMDDIDRLDKSEIQTVFKLVKLTANFPRVTYVLAFDEAMVASALSERYGSGDDLAGHEFLEKIVQLPLHLPAVQPEALDGYFFSTVAHVLASAGIGLTDEQTQEFQHRYMEGLRSRLTTPRAAVRLSNALSLTFPSLAGEIHPVDLIMMEGMRILYPRLYDVVRDNPDIVLSDYGKVASIADDRREIGRKTLDSALNGLSPREAGAARTLLRLLFPRMVGLWSEPATEPVSTQWFTKEQRVASRTYFFRYFTLSLLDQDVSDVQFRRIFADLASQSPGEVADAIQALVNDENAGRFLDRIDMRIGELDQTSIRTLAVSLALVSSMFQDKREGWMKPSPFIRTAILVQRLIYSLAETSDQVKVAKEVAQECASVPLLATSVQFEHAALEERLTLASGLTEEQLRTGSYLNDPSVCQKIARRIAQFADVHRPIFSNSASWALTALRVWKQCANGDVVQSYVADAFSQEGDAALDFISCFLPRSAETGLPADPMEGHLTEDDPLHGYRPMYEAVAQLVDPDLVAKALRQAQSAGIGNELKTSGPAVAQRAAQAFLTLHDEQEKGDTTESGS